MAALIHLYGPFSINSFGLFIAIGICFFSFLFIHDAQARSIITREQYYTILSFSIIIGLLGGRLLFFAESWQEYNFFWDFFTIWKGGFSLLGGIMLLLLSLPIFLRNQGINSWLFLDRASLYAPSLQAISRIGCFFAGCCGGVLCPTFRHPTALYSATALLFIFFILYFFIQHICAKPGQLLVSYLLFMSAERFFVDYWRGDRTFLGNFLLFSFPQLCALSIAMLAFCFLGYIHLKSKNYESV